MIEKDIPQDILKILKLFEPFIFDFIESGENIGDRNKRKIISKDEAISDEYLFNIMKGGSGSGGPTHILSNDFGLEASQPHKELLKLSTKLASFVGARRSPLCQHYPPGGYIAWHHNANIPGRNIIFSWSETGDGIFKVYGDSKEIEEYQDTVGWNIKSLKIISHLEYVEENKEYAWHCAGTNCNRFSVGFMMNNDFHEDVEFCNEVLKEDIGLVHESPNGVWY